MSSVSIQAKPKFREIFQRRDWNRFWNREPFGPGTVGEDGEKNSKKSVVEVTGFEPATSTSQTWRPVTANGLRSTHYGLCQWQLGGNEIDPKGCNRHIEDPPLVQLLTM
jgi:hypothetical protein